MVERRPRFDLTRLAKATTNDNFTLGGSRCRDILLAYLGDFPTVRLFVREVADALGQEDFCVTRSLEGRTRLEDFDEYGVELSDDVLDRYGLEEAAWYVKFTLREGQWGEEAFYISLHPLERPMERGAGWLFPRKRFRA